MGRRDLKQDFFFFSVNENSSDLGFDEWDNRCCQSTVSAPKAHISSKAKPPPHLFCKDSMHTCFEKSNAPWNQRTGFFYKELWPVERRPAWLTLSLRAINKEANGFTTFWATCHRLIWRFVGLGAGRTRINNNSGSLGQGNHHHHGEWNITRHTI